MTTIKMYQDYANIEVLMAVFKIISICIQFVITQTFTKGN